VLLTGATGTLGRQLLPRLVAAGHVVRALSRRPRPAATADVDWVGAALRAGENLALLHADGRITFDQFLAASSDD
jgi:uncharacterized protein YbjT (DUF2867 family)